MSGNGENDERAADHVATLKNLPAEVVTATALFSDGDLATAESIVRAYLQKHGNNVEAMRLLARIGIAHDVLDDAEILLEAVLELAPDYRKARFEYARVLLDRHKHTRAIEELEKLLAQEPENRQFKTLFATAWCGIGPKEKALSLYRQPLPDTPQEAGIPSPITPALEPSCRA